jgi:hypothetical protein
MTFLWLNDQVKGRRGAFCNFHVNSIKDQTYPCNQMANEYFVHQQIVSNGDSVPYVNNNQLPHLLYSCCIWARLNACQTKCNKALNWRKMWPKKQKNHTKNIDEEFWDYILHRMQVQANNSQCELFTNDNSQNLWKNKNNCFMVLSRRFKWHLLMSILHVFSATRSFCISSAFLDWLLHFNHCVGKEMPISRIVIAVLNTTVVLLD